MLKKSFRSVAILVVVLALIVSLFVYIAEIILSSPNAKPATSHYLIYNGASSKIFLIDAATSYGNANETYTTPAGQVVQKGNPLFIITVTLRNDYTSDNPPPSLPNKVQTSPADGTAYLYLTAQLHNKDGTLNATDVSVSDFSLPSTQGTGLVLASGQTTSVNIFMAISQTNIDRCDVKLIFLGDSILL